MPLLVSQDLNVVSQVDLTYQVLDGSDTFVFSPNGAQLLLVRNPTGGTINATLIGDGAPASVTCQGIGDVPVTPEALDLATTEDASLYLNVIATKLSGVVTISTGTGLEVALVQI